MRSLWIAMYSYTASFLHGLSDGGVADQHPWQGNVIEWLIESLVLIISSILEARSPDKEKVFVHV